MAQVETKNRATSSEDSRKRTLARIEPKCLTDWRESEESPAHVRDR